MSDVRKFGSRFSPEALGHLVSTSQVLDNERSVDEFVLGTAKDGTALNALCAALVVSRRFATPNDFERALDLAAQGPTGASAAVGALLGALHGVDVFPATSRATHELVATAEVLAIDALTEEVVGAGARPEAFDGFWWERYPGW